MFHAQRLISLACSLCFALASTFLHLSVLSKDGEDPVKQDPRQHAA